jgi:two-component system, NtrC family, sensor kinase
LIRTLIYIVGILILTSFSSFAVVLDLEAIDQETPELHVRGHFLGEGWVYYAGEHVDGASLNLDDRAWQKIDTPMGPETFSGLDWKGLGWFRYSFQVQEDLRDIPLIMLLAQIGASEIYLDGTLIGTFGTVGSGNLTEQMYVINNLTSFVSIPPLAVGDHVVAVKFSNAEAAANIFYNIPAGFQFVIGHRDNGVMLRERVMRVITLHQMLSVIPLSMSLLHFLLFLFNRHNREDLYYSLLTLSIAGMIYAPMSATFSHDVGAYVMQLTCFKLSLALSGVFGLWFMQHFFEGRISSYFKFVVASGIILSLLALFLSVEIYFIFLVFTYPVAVRIIFRAFCQKKRGAGIVGVGLLIFMGCCLLQILLELNVIDLPILFFPYIYGSIGLVIAMSCYLAQVFAQTHQNLEQQLQQVKELSALALAQERDSKLLEEQAQEEEATRRLLEADNAQKTKALEEARERQGILGELQETHVALKDTQEKLVQSEKMASLGNLVAGIAHEINTPVGAINSMHDTLMRAMGRLLSTLETEFGDTLQNDRSMRAPLQVISDANRVIATGSERVTEIVRSLRSFARLDDAERKEANLIEGIENTLTLVYHDLKNRIDVVKEYDDLPLVQCFPSRLNQVFLNLLVNAAQAIEGQGQITIRARNVGETVEIGITDTGRGISQENVSRIFDPGFTTKGVGVGTGLGLSICYQIMEDHQGEIRVSSKEGEGTTFIVSLPVNTKENKIS